MRNPDRIGLVRAARDDEPQPLGRTQIDYQFPDGSKADSTQTWGINPPADMVGFYIKAGVTHGFLLSAGSYSPIDCLAPT
jgi:hypothetical protein